MSTATLIPSPGPSDPGVVLARAVADLSAAGERVRAALSPEAVAALPDAAVAQLAQQLATVAEVATAGAHAGLGRVADCGYAQVEGFVSTGTWWASRTGVGKDTATEQVRLAQRLRRHYPATAVAWTGGAATGEHATVIATGVDSVLHRMKARLRRDAATAGEPVDPVALAATLDQARGVLEGELLTLATRWGPETLRIALKHARLAADPDGASKAVMDAEADARLVLVEVGDTAVLTAHLPVQVGAKLRTILDHYRDKLHHTGDGPDARKPTRLTPDEVDPVTGDPIVRSNKQRDAAAFMAMLDAALDGGLGSNPVSERPHLDVVVTLADLLNGKGAAVLERTGTPIPATSTARITCDADVRVLITDGQFRDPHTGEVLDPMMGAVLQAGTGVLDYGRSHRTVPARLRRLIGHRDRGCVFPGCHRPPQHCQVHHVIPWQHGGDTNLENCVMICSRHHHLTHEGGWKMVPRQDIPFWQPGHWQFIRPPRPPLP